MRPTVIFLYNSSDYAPRPWIDDGRFNCVSVDFDSTDHSGAHTTPQEGHTVLNIDLSLEGALEAVQGQLLALKMSMPSLVISFSPCTDLAVSGAAHFARKLEANPLCQIEAVRMARLAEKFGCPYMVENPVSVLATMWRKPDMYWHPWHFAGYCPTGPHPEFPEVIPTRDRYNKKTCLWTGNGFVHPVPCELSPLADINPGHALLGGKSARTKYIRSLTPRGFSQAVFDCNYAQILKDTSHKSVLDCPTMEQLELM